MQTRYTTKIQLGTFEAGRLGFIMTFSDESTEAFAFDLATAESLFRQGLQLVEAVQRQRERMPDERIGIQDQPTIRLVP